MSRGAFQRARWRVLFDGQSLNWFGLVGATVSYLPEHQNPYPEQMMVDWPTVPWKRVAVSATSWTDLATTAATRLHPQFGWADNTVLVMCGGQSDLFDDDSGATVYSDMDAYADAARTAGCDWVIATTISPSSTFTGAENDERLDANQRIVADASNTFDGVADLCVSPINDPADTAYYFPDALHWLDDGAAAAAAIVKPVLEAIPGFPAAA